MRLSELASAVNKAGHQVSTNHTFLIYGLSKMGKTELVATVANAPEFKTIYWFDVENGIETLLRMHRDGRLTEEAMNKIIYIKIPDTRENPLAIQTLLKSICTKSAVTICEKHGTVNCADCKRNGSPVIDFDYKSLTPEDALVIDSLSQAGDSALNLACVGKPVEYKLQLDDYGAAGKWLGDLCTTIQAAQYCPIFCITHASIEKDELGAERFMPICGSSTFSAKVAKYFGTVVFMEKKLGKHKANSTTLSSMTTMAGSRLGIVLDKQSIPDLAEGLRAAGYLGQSSNESAAKAEAPASGLAGLLKKSTN